MQLADLQNYQLTRDRVRMQTRALVRYCYANLIIYALLSVDDMTIEESRSYSKAIESEVINN